MSSAETPSPLKRPRLSLQIMAIAGSPSMRASSRTLAAAVDVKDPTDFNTLSNVYATAVDRVTTPVQEIMSPRMAPGSSARKPRLQLQTSSHEAAVAGGSHRRTLALNTATTSSPTTALFPSAATLSSANPHQPGRAAGPQSPADPRLSSGVTPMILPSSTYATSPISLASPSSLYASSHRNNTPRHRGSMPGSLLKPPYTHPRALRSILRNSPLPPLSASANKSPASPRRQSLRIQQQRERAARRVAYNSPLCQTITTSKYTQSHMELVHQHQQHQHQQNLDTDNDDSTPISADSTPSSASSASDSQDESSSPGGAEEQEQEQEQEQDMFLLSPGLDARDGGQTPGPLEEMRRRPTGAGLGGRGGSTIISSSSSSQPLPAVSIASVIFSSAPASTPLSSSSSPPTTALGSGGGSSGRGGGGRTEVGGVRKRKNKKSRRNRKSVHSSGNCDERPKQHEKKRLWEWTIDSDGEDLEADVLLPMTAGEAQRRREHAAAAAAAVPVLAVPVPPVRSRSSSVSGVDGGGDGGGGSKRGSQTAETAVRMAPPPLLVQVAAPGPGTGWSVQVLGFTATRSRRLVGGGDGAAMLEIPGRAGEKNPVGDQGKARRGGGGEGFASFELVMAAAADPEPEPPTPSVQSTASHQDSVFEADVDEDVDMSDASSLMSVDDVDDMLAMDAADDKTPTASARPSVFEMT